jgi:anti-sigma factor RsiW
MACEEFEHRILEYLENQLPPAEQPAVETHLAGCVRCQAFARQLQQLDAALARGITSPMLPSDFSARLQQRIQTESAFLSETQRAERQRQLQAEYEADLAHLRRKSLSPAILLDSLGYALLAALAGWLIWVLTSTWTNLATQPGPDRSAQPLLLSCLISAVFLLLGLTIASPRHLKKLCL